MLVQEVFSIFSFAFIVGLGYLSNFFLHRVEVKPLKISDEAKHTGQFQFISERAYQNLKTLNDFGPKVTGSDANEIKAFNFIFDQVHEIRNSSIAMLDISIDHQVVSGHNFERSVYKNIQNIVVRYQGTTDNALMLNCHFDSVAGSPGASDDIVMCCVMMEILRILSKTVEKQKHSIIFLFNGSEEEDLQASHGFITKHKWAKDVKAYINLESTGSDGREILFRTGPKHDWLIRLYRQSVPRPFGHSVAEELFETGVIPSATDFQIFRDAGEIPGLDFAYVENGWRYHTRYDSIDYISKKSVQHTGENILELTKKIANSEELSNPPEGSFAIYFDYLGIFFVSYSRGVGITLNVIVSILSVTVPFVIQTKLKIGQVRFVVKETLISFGTIFASTAISGLTCYLIAVIMNAADNTMSWFNTTFLSIGIYGSIAVFIQIATYDLIQFTVEKFGKKKKNEQDISTRHLLKIHLNGINLFWAIITLTITFAGFRFGYITMVLLFVSLCTNILTYISCKVLPQTRTHSWIFLHIFGHSLAFLWLCYMMFQVWELFIPITAKQYYSNPDIMIALICTLWSVLCLSYFMPLTTLVQHRAILYSTLMTVFVVSIILSFTSIGFPYSANKSDPRVQRFRVIHTKRTFYDENGSEKHSNNGYLISASDRNAVRTLESSFDPKDLQEWRNDEMCKSEIYCGFPMYRFDQGRYLKNFQIMPSVKPSKFSILQASRNPNNSSQIIVDYSLELTALTMVYISAGKGWNYVSGSLQTSERIWNDKKFRLSKITYGKKTDEILREYITLEALEDSPNVTNVVTITIVTIESVFKKNDEYKLLMEKMPDYTFAMENQADVSSYKVKER